ncbi:MAG: hypothetical protein II433_08225, partial [Acidaminococcaceae bacterium]|nr:hypothetical protein [Acidaminococcaceae bacterium]
MAVNQGGTAGLIILWPVLAECGDRSFIWRFCNEGDLIMIKEAIVKIVSKEDLTYEEAYTV